MIRRAGRPALGFALGDDRAEHLRATLTDLLAGIERFSKSLTPREETILRLGLEASHMEESVAHGDWTRAESHAEAIVKLFQRLG